MISKYLNQYWILSTVMGLWFLFIHAPPVLQSRKAMERPMFLAHLLGAYVLYLCCIHNSLITPSAYHGKAKGIHTWVGRVGMVAGLLGFAGGLYLVVTGWNTTDDHSFYIGITIGGIMQLDTQYRGYTAIRKYKACKDLLSRCKDENEKAQLKEQRDEALKSHINNMAGLFFMACGIPAMMRGAEALFGIESFWLTMALVGLMNMMQSNYSKKLTQGIGSVISKKRVKSQ